METKTGAEGILWPFSQIAVRITKYLLPGANLSITSATLDEKKPTSVPSALRTSTSYFTTLHSPEGATMVKAADVGDVAMLVTAGCLLLGGVVKTSSIPECMAPLGNLQEIATV